MNLLDGMKKNSTITNTKGAEYYMTTYDSNLDVFTMLSRYHSDEELIRLFNNALNENEELALAKSELFHSSDVSLNVHHNSSGFSIP